MTLNPSAPVIAQAVVDLESFMRLPFRCSIPRFNPAAVRPRGADHESPLIVAHNGPVASFRKARVDAPAGFFEVEAAGLRWLAAADAVRVAGVLAVGRDHIEVEQFSSVPATRQTAEVFGRDLARLHDAGATGFGSPPDGWIGDGWIGDAPLPLHTEPTWGDFYARHRVWPYARSADARGDLPAGGLAVIEKLCERLESGGFDDPAPPARLHGDLWSGNVLYTSEGAALIDPAAHGGHRITDLAMLALFGSPHLGVVHAAYAEASAHLPDGWRDLIALHQVHPLLVHAVLFGGSYGAQAVQAARHVPGSILPRVSR